jgi:hypothetical protein
MDQGEQDSKGKSAARLAAPATRRQGAPKGKKRAAAGSKRRSEKVRRADQGDVAPELSAKGIEEYAISERVLAANESKAMAVRDILSQAARSDSASLIESFEAILAGAAPDDVLALKALLTRYERAA